MYDVPAFPCDMVLKNGGIREDPHCLLYNVKTQTSHRTVLKRNRKYVSLSVKWQVLLKLISKTNIYWTTPTHFFCLCGWCIRFCLFILKEGSHPRYYHKLKYVKLCIFFLFIKCIHFRQFAYIFINLIILFYKFKFINFIHFHKCAYKF